MSSRIPGVSGDDNRLRPTSPFQRIADRVETVASLGEAEFDERSVMDDLRPVQAVREMLSPLIEAGFALTDFELVSDIDFGRHRGSALVRRDEVHYLAHLPAKFLKSDKEGHRHLLYALLFAFPKDAHVIVLSHKLDAIPRVSVNILEMNPWAQAEFVAWLHLCGSEDGGVLPLPLLLKALRLTPNDDEPSGRPARVLSVVGLPRASAPLKPTDAEFRSVSENLARILEVQADPAASYADFVQSLTKGSSQLSQARAHWNADTSVATNNLVIWAWGMGSVTFGRLVVGIVSLAPGRDDAEWLLDIVSRHCTGLAAEVDDLRRTVADLRP